MHDHDHRISQPMVTRALVRSTQIRICSINPSLWPVCVCVSMHDVCMIMYVFIYSVGENFRFTDSSQYQYRQDRPATQPSRSRLLRTVCLDMYVRIYPFSCFLDVWICMHACLYGYVCICACVSLICYYLCLARRRVHSI